MHGATIKNQRNVMFILTPLCKSMTTTVKCHGILRKNQRNVMFILTPLHKSMTTTIKCHGILRKTDRIVEGRSPALSQVRSKFITAFTKPEESKSHPQSSCHLDEFLCYTIIYSYFLRVSTSLTKQIEKSFFCLTYSTILHSLTKIRHSNFCCAYALDQHAHRPFKI
jgi:hypothetical protein